MAENTEISWCDSTFNPFIGCTKVSPGCDNCYAEHTMDKRLHRVVWGPGNPRVRTSAANWKKPLQWNERAYFECTICGWRGENDSPPCRCLHANLRTTRRRVFCASLADVFDNQVDPRWRVDLFALIAATPNLDWLLLTKRIGNVATMLGDYKTVPLLPNIWLGATVVNQEEADRDIPKLLAVPAAVRFLSMEPLLGPVDIARYLKPACDNGSVPGPGGMGGVMCSACNGFGRCRGVDWVIVGGESGPGARPMHPGWARSLRDQCAAAGVPLHFKQHGEWVWVRDIKADDCKRGLWVRRNGETHDGTAEAQFSKDGSDALVWHVGKKAAGRLLDGVTHDSFPEAP